MNKQHILLAIAFVLSLSIAFTAFLDLMKRDGIKAKPVAEQSFVVLSDGQVMKIDEVNLRNSTHAAVSLYFLGDWGGEVYSTHAIGIDRLVIQVEDIPMVVQLPRGYAATKCATHAIKKVRDEWLWEEVGLEGPAWRIRVTCLQR